MTNDIGNLTKTRPAPAQNFNNRPKPEKTFGEKKLFGLKKIGPKNFLFKRFFGYEKILSPKNVLG